MIRETLMILGDNVSYDYQHRLTADDVVKATKTAEAMENLRKSFDAPLPGDVVEFTNSWGKSYPRAHLEGGALTDEDLSICEEAYKPWAHLRASGAVGISASGGAWHGVNLEQRAQFIADGWTVRYFQDWGHCGGCANGAVTFPVTVRKWKYVETPKPQRRDYAPMK